MTKIFKIAGISALLALTLTACATGENPSQSGPGAPDTSNSDGAGSPDISLMDCTEYESAVFETALNMCGSPGEIAGLEFQPITQSSEDVRYEVLEEGTGEELDAEKIYYLSFSSYNAQTGEALFNKATNAGYTPVMLLSPSWVEEYPAWLLERLNEARVGERFAIEVSQDAEDGEIPGVHAGENILWVFDVKQELKLVADGEDQTPSGDLPQVSLDESGAPQVTVPAGNPSDTLQLEVLKKGSGDVVPENAEVYVQYQGTNWRTGEVFDQTWNRGAPTNFKLNQVVTGFSKAIAGQTVGSQVIVTIPPADGYGANGNPQADISGTDTLIFVIDILASISGP